MILWSYGRLLWVSQLISGGSQCASVATSNFTVISMEAHDPHWRLAKSPCLINKSQRFNGLQRFNGFQRFNRSFMDCLQLGDFRTYLAPAGRSGRGLELDLQIAFDTVYHDVYTYIYIMRYTYICIYNFMHFDILNLTFYYILSANISLSIHLYIFIT